MPNLNPDQITARNNQAAAYLASSRDADPETGAEALATVVHEDVPALLAELERLTVNHDSGYVNGLRSAARWLNGFAKYSGTLPELDRNTCAALADGATAMAESAQQRLGVDAEPIAEALVGFMAESSFAGYAALHDVKQIVGLRRALCEMIAAVDGVAHGRAQTGNELDRPLLPHEQEAFTAQLGGAR